VGCAHIAHEVKLLAAKTHPCDLATAVQKHDTYNHPEVPPWQHSNQMVHNIKRWHTMEWMTKLTILSKKQQIEEPYVFLYPRFWEREVFLGMYYFFPFTTLGTIHKIVVVC
jgi:hypothetical protein